ncbi:hypothetical protein R3W88_019524 [Solanum pinnatisectum]|uniref:Uncharacterized protein n=1 Tax=Solanum pinnatisectum TaxID=50273 RepID=A0AAV9KJR7_9SOLN|nr:hypothetical protein R3W88_019524 [Solanum pinnatisectum]
MDHAGILQVTSDGSHTHVGGQTPDPMGSPVSHTPKTQPTVVIAPYLDTIPMYEANYSMHSCLSSMHTSQGSSSRPLGHRGHSDHLESFHQDCPRIRRGGSNQGCQASTSKVVQPPTRVGI